MSSSEHTYKFDVKMSCGGCSGAVNRALKKAQEQGDGQGTINVQISVADVQIGITEYNVDLETQEVIVKGTLGYEDVLEKIKKTGKEVRSGTTIE